MGILNVTPDSFSDGGHYATTQKAFLHAKQLITEGADIIDIGGESTRPGAETVSATEELQRVLPVIKKIKTAFPKTVLSIDTWKNEVAKEAIKNGCTVINSLGGFTFDENLAKIVAKYNATVIIYHIKGKPKTMQKKIIRYKDIISDITQFFSKQITIAKKYGIKKTQLILDPGIGFGKTVEQNITIIKNLKRFKILNLPLAIGMSRKSHLGIILEKEIGLQTKPTERLEPSLAETAIAIQQGVDIIRTHDVLATKKFVTVLEKFL
ncbi:MAG TPA: dihydropteroate synthase [Patescibacteria group bacterium]|nr:dihydropteroate synthase [Patescibacteria group bacterium]